MMKAYIHISILITTFLFSCRETNHADSYIDSTEHDVSESNAEFKQVEFNCQGDGNYPSDCKDLKNKIGLQIDYKSGIFYLDASDKSYAYQNDGGISELGVKSYLFESKNAQNILLIDNFIENGNLYFAYLIENNKITFLGKKEIFSEGIHPNAYNFRINKSDDLITIQLNDRLEKLNFQLGDSNLVPEKSKFLDSLMNSKIKTPAEITDNLIFYKDAQNKLKINSEYLNYIQKNTTATQNQYVLALEKYVTQQIIKYYDYSDKRTQWTEEDLIKIVAYASNTTDPLFKNLWTKSPQNWQDGKWGNVLSFCYIVYPDTLWIKMQKQFEREDFYNLPYLKDMVIYATKFDKFGPPETIEK